LSGCGCWRRRGQEVQNDEHRAGSTCR
jgi:hypothetical protein